MTMHPPHAPRRLLSLILAATLAGCLPLNSMTGVGHSDVPSFGAVGGSKDTLVSNNSASLAGVIRGPATLVSNNVAGYRAQAYEDAPAQQAVVYLTAPDERFYAGDDGKAIFTVTDDQGRYAFKAAPAEVPVVVTVLLAQNRRLVGFMIPKKGANTYDVDLATTVVAEFFRDQARLAKRSMADYPALTNELPEIIRLTRELINSGKLPVPDLEVNAIPAMRHAYVRAFGADDQALSDAWKRLLGYRPLLLDEVDAKLEPGLNALSVHVAEDGSLYTAGFNNFDLQIVRRKLDGSLETITKAPRNEWIDYVGGMLAVGDTLHVGAAGSSHYGFDLLTSFNPDDLFENNSLWFESGATANDDTRSFTPFDLAYKDGWFYATSDSTNEVVRYHAPADYDFDENGEMFASNLEVVAGDRDEATTFVPGQDAAASNGSAARLNYPSTLTLQTVGGKDYLYVSDTLNHRIKRIDLSSPTFSTETVLGFASMTPYGNMLKPPGALEDGKLPQSKTQGFTDLDSPEGVPKAKATLAYPHKVVFDAQGRMFIADQDHRRVRMFDGQKVYTLAGTEPGVASAIGDSRRAGLGEVASIAFDKDGNLLIADGRSNKLRRLWLTFGL
ncbi:NHL repeat protein [compost metagenome]